MRVVLFANTEWYLYNFRLNLARALRAAGVEVVLLSPSGPYGALLEKEGFRWISVPMNRLSLNPIRELALLWRLVLLYLREKPALVHHFTIKCVVYGSLAARLAGIGRRVNAVTGMGYVFANNHRSRFLRPLVLRLMRFALGGRQSRVILQNADDCDVFRSARLAEPLSVRLVRGSGVNTEVFYPRAVMRTQKHFRVLFAARLLWDKGVGEYVEAARLLKGLDIEFLIAGSPDKGNPTAVPADTVALWHHSGLVTVLGHVDAMPNLLREVDVAVLPTYYREGVPKGLVEAAACGLPIITTDTPGCRDIADAGQNGLLVPSRDPNALANAIRFLYEHPTERSRMGIAGREKVLRQFDENIVLRETLSVYRELIPDMPSTVTVN